MTNDKLELLPLDEQVVHWIDELAEGMGGHALATAHLMERHRRYYAVRVPEFMELPGDTAWWGECPCCDGLLAIDGLTGWWICGGCMRRGEMFTMEYLLNGRHEPERWASCQRAAEAIMALPATVEPMAGTATAEPMAGTATVEPMAGTATVESIASHRDGREVA